MNAGESRPIISVSDLFFRYPGSREKKNALERINLDIFRGERVGILGESGSGKTTLSLILAGLEALFRSFFIGGCVFKGEKHTVTTVPGFNTCFKIPQVRLTGTEESLILYPSP